MARVRRLWPALCSLLLGLALIAQGPQGWVMPLTMTASAAGNVAAMDSDGPCAPMESVPAGACLAHCAAVAVPATPPPAVAIVRASCLVDYVEPILIGQRIPPDPGPPRRLS